MDSRPAPTIAMVPMPVNTGGQIPLPHPNLPVNFSQPSQPLQSPGLDFGQTNIYPNQPHLPASADTDPQLTAAPYYSPGTVPSFSKEKADEQPWR